MAGDTMDLDIESGKSPGTAGRSGLVGCSAKNQLMGTYRYRKPTGLRIVRSLPRPFSNALRALPVGLWMRKKKTGISLREFEQAKYRCLPLKFDAETVCTQQLAAFQDGLPMDLNVLKMLNGAR